jgi:uncharacterized protein (DUF433 family)
MTKYICSDPSILGGTPVFRGTRVPVAALFDNLADGFTVEQILAEFPTLNRDDVLAVLHAAPETLARSAA